MGRSRPRSARFSLTHTLDTDAQTGDIQAGIRLKYITGIAKSASITSGRGAGLAGNQKGRSGSTSAPARIVLSVYDRGGLVSVVDRQEHPLNVLRERGVVVAPVLILLQLERPGQGVEQSVCAEGGAARLRDGFVDFGLDRVETGRCSTPRSPSCLWGRVPSEWALTA